MAKDKEENVYVKADAYGRTREITVETSLKADPDSDVIEDVSSLSSSWRNIPFRRCFLREFPQLSLLQQWHSRFLLYFLRIRSGSAQRSGGGRFPDRSDEIFFS